MLQNEILLQLEQFLGQPAGTYQVAPVSGGDINQAFKVTAKGKSVFVKTNSLSLNDMLVKEVDGLACIEKAVPKSTPKIIAQGKSSTQTFLALEWIEAIETNSSFWYNLGINLARLHENSNDTFGFESDNYIGTLAQSNSAERKWTDFFINSRLEPQIQLAFNNGLLAKKHLAKFSSLYNELDSIFPLEKPALLHGDLWIENILCSKDGDALFIDPSVYYGHREVDLAFTLMFGSFSAEMFEAYKSILSIEQGFGQRVPVFNLYPTLVHLNLFGRAYLPQIEQIIKKF